MEVFIFRDRESSADKNKLETKGQYQWLGSVLSNNGSKILLFILFCHFFLLPVFRFIWVSYKCEDVTGGISGEKCNKPCTSDNDCVPLMDIVICVLIMFVKIHLFLNNVGYL